MLHDLSDGVRGAVSMQFRPAHYREHWDSIKAGVAEALKYQHERLRPEDVFADLKLGRAFLWLCDDGFIILRSEMLASDERVLLIWLAYSNARGSVIEKYAADVEQIARDIHCRCIDFVSTRRGYERAVPEGYFAVHTRWRKRLDRPAAPVADTVDV